MKSICWEVSSVSSATAAYEWVAWILNSKCFFFVYNTCVCAEIYNHYIILNPYIEYIACIETE